MATLFNTKISATYEGLLKTINNAALSATLRELTDGSGNQSGLFLNTAGDFKVTSVLEWGSLKDTGTGVTITQFVTAANGIENFNNDTTLPTSAAVKLYVDTKFSQTDTLTEVLGFGNTTSGKDIAVSANDDITFTDTSKAIFGTGNDLSIFHDSNNSYINETGTGFLFITSGEQIRLGNPVSGEKFARFFNNAQVELFYDNTLRFETTTDGSKVTGDLLVTGNIVSNGAGGSFLPIAGGTMTGNTIHNDNVKSIYGTASDGLEIVHDGGNSRIKDTGTGSLVLSSSSFFIQNGSGNLISGSAGGTVELTFNGASKLTTTNTGVSVTGALSTTTNLSVGNNAFFVDNGKALFGASSDLQIFHDGSNSKIVDGGTGDLRLAGNVVRIRNSADTENMISAVQGGAVSLAFNNTTRLETVTDGAKVTGNLVVTGNITANGGGSFLRLDGGTMTGNTIHNDNVKSIYGTASDGLEIFHNGTNSFISDTGTGSLLLKTSALLVRNPSDASMIDAQSGGAINLYYNSSKKFETTNTGIAVTGNIVPTGSVNIPDFQFLTLGNSNDFTFLHNGSGSVIKNFTGALNIEQAAITQSIVVKVSNANALDTTALTINREGDLITGADVTIAGDLTVNGTTTTVNSQTLSVADPLISLATANTANSLDIGFYGKYNDGTARYLGLFNDASDSNKFRLFRGTTVEPTTTVNIGGTGYVAADLVVAGLEATTFTTTGDLLVEDNIYLTDAGTTRAKIQLNSSDRDNLDIKAVSLGSTMNFFTADTLALSLSASQIASFAGDVIVNGGNLGVGMTPTEVLDIKTTSGDCRMRLDAPSGSDTEVKFFNAGAAQYTIGHDDASDEFRIATTNVEDPMLSFTKAKNASFAGNIIAGSNAVQNGANPGLEVRSTNTSQTVLSIDNTTTRNYELAVGGTASGIGSGSFYIYDGTAAATRLVIDTSGNSTFAGNISSSGTLQLVGNTDSGFLSAFQNLSTSASAYSGFRIRNSDGGFAEFWRNSTTKSGTGNAALSLNIYNSADVNLWSGGTHTMALVGNNVGIGVTNPSANLEIKGATGNAGYTLKTTDVNDNEIFFIKDGGRVGVRYSPFSVGIPSTTAVATNAIFQVEEAGWLTVLDGGNVGINELSPDAKLHIKQANSGTVTTIITEDGARKIFIGRDSIKCTDLSNNATALFIQQDGGLTQTGGDFKSLGDVTVTGTVGVGTTAIYSTDRDLNLSGKGVSLKNNVNGSNNNWSYIHNTATGSNSNLVFQTGNAAPLTLDHDGKAFFAEDVGIGTTTLLNTTAARTVVTIGNSTSNFLNFSNASSTRFGGIYTDSTQLVLLSDTFLKFETGSPVSEKMRITAGGNLQMKNDTFLSWYSGAGTEVENLGIQASDANGIMKFYTEGVERQRITNTGEVLIRRTVDFDANLYFLQVGDATLDNGTPIVTTVASTATRTHILFSNFNSNNVGSISTQGSATSYNTSSDYRLKEDLQDFEGLDLVSKIPVYNFKWKTDERRSYGVMAHELQKVLPQAVSGQKDAEDMQSVDYSKIVPLLIKSIQELTAKVERLEAK